MRKLGIALICAAATFLCSPVNAYMMGNSDVKPVYNPQTARPDLITNISTNNIVAGTGVTVVNNSTGVTISATGGGGGSSSLAVYQTGVQVSSPTSALNFVSPLTATLLGSTSAQIGVDASSVTLRGQTGVIWNTNSLQSNSTFYTSSGSVQALNIPMGYSTLPGISINGIAGQSSDFINFYDSSGNKASALQSDKSWLIPYASANLNSVTYKDDGTFGNTELKIQRNYVQNNQGWGTYLTLADANSVYAQIKLITNIPQQAAMDLEFWAPVGQPTPQRVYAAPYAGGNYYYNPAVFTADPSVLKIPSQILSSAGGHYTSPLSNFTIDGMQVGGGTGVEVDEYTALKISSAPYPVNDNGGVATVHRPIDAMFISSTTGTTNLVLRTFSGQTTPVLAVDSSSTNIKSYLDANGGAYFSSTFTLATSTIVINGSTGYWNITRPASNKIFQMDSSGNVTLVSDQTGSGGGGSIAVATGTSAGFGGTISSPTVVLNFDSGQFVGALTGAATAYVKIDTISTTGMLTNSSATATYLTQSSATVTYILKSSSTIVYTDSNQTISGVKTVTSSFTVNNIIQGTTIYATQNGATPVTGISNAPLQILGNANSFVQANIQNFSTGTAASSDLVITSNLGGNTSNYVNLGINSSNFSQAAQSIVPSTWAYLWTSDHGMAIGTGVNGTDSTADLVFFTSAPTTTNERMRIKTNGAIVDTSSHTFNGTVVISSGLIASGSAGTSGQFLTSGGAGTIPTWTTSSGSGDMILASTQTSTGAKTWNSYSNFVGSVTFSSTVTINNISTMTFGTGTGLDTRLITVVGSTFTMNRIVWADGTIQVSSPPANSVGVKQVFLPENAQFLTTNFPQLILSTFTNIPVSALGYDAATSTEAAHWKFRANGYTSGNLTLDLYWYAATASSGDVLWSAAVAAITPDTDTQDILTKAYDAFATVTDTHLGTTVRRLHKATITLSSIDSLAADDIVWIKIGRSGASSLDTMAGDANLVYATLTY